ncbi:MAG: hypothetical protein AW07_01609 [Candidatus Accumulibacter sp. SK-11]|nr:MAG: hypothetical protein AW07_01609 [Candidatus Accumulibacter sp. SK-11]
MNADEDARIGGIAPLAIGHAVQTVRTEALHRALAHLVDDPGHLPGPRTDQQFAEFLQYCHDPTPTSLRKPALLTRVSSHPANEVNRRLPAADRRPCTWHRGRRRDLSPCPGNG